MICHLMMDKVYIFEIYHDIQHVCAKVRGLCWELEHNDMKHFLKPNVFVHLYMKLSDGRIKDD